jgi:hypothetical protein
MRAGLENSMFSRLFCDSWMSAGGRWSRRCAGARCGVMVGRGLRGSARDLGKFVKFLALNAHKRLEVFLEVFRMSPQFCGS